MSGLGEAPARIRPGRAEDAEACSQIERLCAAQFADSPHPGFAELPPAPPGAYLALAQQGGLIAAELAGGTLAGFLAVEAEAESLHLRELDVAPAFQGRGIARRLVEAAAVRAAREGLRALTLTTWADVIWNAPAYARMGFREARAGERTPLCRRDAERLAAGGFDVSARIAMIRPLGG